MLRRVCFASGLLLLLTAGAFADTRTWTDSTGKFKMEANFIEIVEGQVKLERPDGKKVSLPLAKLSKDDQQYLRDLMKQRRSGGAPEEANPFSEPPTGGNVRGAGRPGVGGWRIGDRVEVRDFRNWELGRIMGFDTEWDKIFVTLDSGKTVEVHEGKHWIRLPGTGDGEDFIGGLDASLPGDEALGGGDEVAPRTAGKYQLTQPDMASINRIVPLGDSGGSFQPDGAAVDASVRPRPSGLSPKPGFFAKTTSMSVAPGGGAAAVVMVGGPEMGDTDSVIEICDLKTGRVQAKLAGPRNIKLLALSPTGKRLATIAEVETFQMGPVQTWEINGKELKHLKSWRASTDEHGRQLEWMGWIDDERLMTLDQNGLTMWHAGEVRGIYQLGIERAKQPAFSPGGKQFALAHDEGVDIHDVETGELVVPVPMDDVGYNRLAAFSPSGKQIAVTGTATVSLYDIASGELLTQAYAPSAGAFNKGLAWVNEKQVLVGGTDLVDVASKMSIWRYNHNADQLASALGRHWYLIEENNQRALLPYQLPHAAVKPVAESELVLKPGDAVALELQIDDGSITAEAETKLKSDLEAAGFTVSTEPNAKAKLVARSGPGESHEMQYRDWGINAQTHKMSVTPREYELKMVVDGEEVWTRKQVQDAPHMLHLKKDQTVDQAVQEALTPKAGMFGVGLPSRYLPLSAMKARSSTLTVNGLK
jgi:hypothetical protein